MADKLKQLIKTFEKEPASNINSLNKIIPSLIQLFPTDPKTVSKNVLTIVQTLISTQLLTSQDIQQVIMKQDSTHSNKSKQFILERLNVMFNNLIELISNVETFDYLSKILLQLYQEQVQDLELQQQLDIIIESPKQFLGKVLVKAMKDKEELQVHFNKLIDQYMDLCLISLIGLNNHEEEISTKHFYSIINDFPVFDEQVFETTIINIKKDKKNDNEGLDDLGLDDDQEEEDNNDEETPEQRLVINETKKQYQLAYLKFLTDYKIKSKLLKKIILELPKKVIPNLESPILLSDFLTNNLNQSTDRELQVLSLRAIFILLEKHGLDYPNFYKKLYEMIKPKISIKDDGSSELQSIFNLPEKARFLRLLDVSLRSPLLATKLIASFIKRLVRVIVCYGEGFAPQDIMYTGSLIINLVKRHPRCLKLIHRRKKDGSVMTTENDPFRQDEEDPMETRAYNSSLWEIDLIMRQHYDSNVRNYLKIFKTDFMRKTAYIKSDEFIQADPIDVLLQELNEIDDAKEGDALKKNLLQKYMQLPSQMIQVGGKRGADQLDQYNNDRFFEMQAEPNKRFKFNEEFEELNDIFALHH